MPILRLFVLLIAAACTQPDPSTGLTPERIARFNAMSTDELGKVIEMARHLQHRCKDAKLNPVVNRWAWDLLHSRMDFDPLTYRLFQILMDERTPRKKPILCEADPDEALNGLLIFTPIKKTPAA